MSIWQKSLDLELFLVHLCSQLFLPLSTSCNTLSIIMSLICLLRLLGIEGILSFAIIFQIKKLRVGDKGSQLMIHPIYSWGLQNKNQNWGFSVTSPVIYLLHLTYPLWSILVWSSLLIMFLVTINKYICINKQIDWTILRELNIFEKYLKLHKAGGILKNQIQKISRG